jgi:hypothetical protein
MDTQSCVTCIHWHPIQQEHGISLLYGHCHRYPPVLNPDAPPTVDNPVIGDWAPRWIFPVTDQNCVCGEHNSNNS